MAEKVTTMRLNVDLHCEKCYKKVKKVLCKFPQIREQVFDEKQNIVTIKVVCCSPEKIRDKLCCKGCGAIKSIEIVEPPKRNSTEPEPPPGPGPPLNPSPPSPPVVPAPFPIGTCCAQCREGRPGGPCFERCGGRPPCHEGYFYARPVYDSYCGGRPCYCLSRCDQYFNEDNPSGCTII